MLMEPKRRLVAGDRVDIELRLQDGTPIGTAAEARAPAAAGSAHEHHHH
jgi:copper(I)-binding protein